MRISFAKAIYFLPFLFLFIACKQNEKQSESPNIIIILTDDQGYQDVGCYGSPDIETPNLDQMAADGIRLTDFYAAQAVCSASRAGILTGCYPNRIGVHNAYMPNSKKGLNPDEVTIAEQLKNAGYATAIHGKWHLGDHPNFMPWNQGFDEYFGIPYSNDMWPLHPQQGPVFDFDDLPLYENENIIDTLKDQSQLTTQITEHSVDFINRNKDKPFFLYVAHPQPHVPLYVSEKFKGKSKRGLYGDVIMEIDWSVGQILSALKQNEIEQNTLVVFTSDNGPWLNYGEHSGSALPLREGKGTAWEGGQREPCIVYYPGKLEAGKSIRTPMMNIDLFPTIAHLTNTELPAHEIDGKNVWDVWTGAETESPQKAYFYYYKVNELHAVRFQNWKLYFPHVYRSLNGREGGKNGFPVDYDQNELTAIELYDLENDISESNNVAELHPEIVEEITQLANDMRLKLGDSLTGAQGSENREVGSIE